MADRCLESAPIYDDVTKYEPAGAACGAEVLSGGWPCQVCSSVSLLPTSLGLIIVSQVIPATHVQFSLGMNVFYVCLSF